jgi:hypothetical protein
VKLSKIAGFFALALSLSVWSPMANTVRGATTTPTPTLVGGTFVINFKITIKSAISKSSVILCDATVEAGDDAAGTYAEEGETAAVRSVATPSTATCTVTIPYSWLLATPTTDHYFFDYAVTNSTFTVLGIAPTLPIRVSKPTPPVVTTGIPKNGATTTETVSITY